MRLRVACALAPLMACALLLAPGAGAAHRHDARHTLYRGKSAQGYRIQIAASRGRLTLIRFKVKMLCRDGSYLYGDASGFEPMRLRGGGRFADVQYGKTDVVAWKGRASTRKLTGTLRVKDHLSNGVRCDSQPLRFVARRVG